MTSRPLTPFLISFALVLVASPRALQAQTAPVGAANAAAAAANPAAEAARAQLLDGLARDLGAHFKAEGEIQLETLRPWNLPTTAAAEEWTATLIEFPSTLSSSLLLRVRLSAPGQASRDDTLTCKTQLFRDAWIAQSPTERGTTFDPSQCEIRRIDALRERDAIPASIANAGEWVYSRPVPVGRTVTWRDVVRRALVRKGEVIDVAAVDGPLQVTMKALAMQDGSQGDTVRVRNIESKREFAAMVVSEKRAQVRF